MARRTRRLSAVQRPALATASPLGESTAHNRSLGDSQRTTSPQVDKITLNTSALQRSWVGNDDDAERQAARQRRRSLAASAASDGQATRRPPRASNAADESSQYTEAEVRGQKLSDEQLAELYASTIKLCAENRVNASNSWKLQLIDYIAAVASTRGAASPSAAESGRAGERNSVTEALRTNFVLAGSTIDAGARIYSCRVDSVHSNAFRILSGLSVADGVYGDDGQEDETEGRRRAAATAGGEDDAAADSDQEADDGEGGETRGAGRRRRGKRGAGGQTLESNLDNITLKKLERDFVVDPLFQKMAAAINEGGAKGLLTNVLDVLPDGALALDSSALADALGVQAAAEMDDDDDAAAAAAAAASDAVIWPAAVNLSPWLSREESSELCPQSAQALRNAEATVAAVGASVPEEERMAGSPTHPAADEPADILDYADGFDIDGAEATLAEERRLREMLQNELTEDSCSLTEEASGEAEPSAARTEVAALMMARGADAFEIHTALDRQRLAGDNWLAATANDLLGSWAGPDQWRPRAAAGGDGGDAPAKRPRGRTAQLLDFRSRPPELDFADKFATGPKRNSHQLSAVALERQTPASTTLPEDMRYTVADMMRLFSVSRRVPLGGSRGEAATETGLGEELDWRAFQDASFCGAAIDAGGDDDEDADVSATVADDIGDALASLYLSEDEGGTERRPALIEAPPTVERWQVGYATVAKRIDVRRLKEHLWQALCTQHAATPESNQEVHLQQLMGAVHTWAPPEQLPELSISYLFICLLHLANEQRLHLHDTPQLDDVLVAFS
ncbi:hypothetical protein CDCA_CDCA02G0715 [Cyanidium caldarium]|uniref:Condensin complex subunit 2 n=1 Tax=Cyanidium caldarium TaxID=2771 RepID=A0AAV9IRH7_CYACA|nr:hypothetical protein CDCA_CDCA02G0715 [Cyanidium caldarium]